MFEPHEGTLQLKNKFQKAYNWLEKRGPSNLKTKSKTRFIAKANITRKGPHSGEKVIRFMQDNKEYARVMSVAGRHYYNCNRTRIGMYCAAVDEAKGCRDIVVETTDTDRLQMEIFNEKHSTHSNGDGSENLI